MLKMLRITATLIVSCNILVGCSRARVESMNEMNEGVVLAQQERYMEAAEKLEKAVTLDSTNDQAFYNLALVQIQQQEFDGAAESLERAIAIDDSVASYHEKLGTALMELKNWKGAKTELEKAIKLEPKLSRAYYKLGQTLEQLEDPQNALHRYTESIYKNPRFVEAYAALASTYLEVELVDQAIQVLKSGQQVVEPGSEEQATLYQLLGTAHQQAREYETAIAEFKKALKISPGMHEALFSIGWTYALKKDNGEAKRFLKKFVELAGADIPDYYIKAARDRLALLEAE